MSARINSTGIISWWNTLSAPPSVHSACCDKGNYQSQTQIIFPNWELLSFLTNKRGFYFAFLSGSDLFSSCLSGSSLHVVDNFLLSHKIYELFSERHTFGTSHALQGSLRKVTWASCFFCCPNFFLITFPKTLIAPFFFFAIWSFIFRNVFRTFPLASYASFFIKVLTFRKTVQIFPLLGRPQFRNYLCQNWGKIKPDQHSWR